MIKYKNESCDQTCLEIDLIGKLILLVSFIISLKIFMSKFVYPKKPEWINKKIKDIKYIEALEG